MTPPKVVSLDRAREDRADREDSHDLARWTVRRKLHDAIAAVKRVERFQRPHGLSQAAYAALVTIAREIGPDEDE